jgi:hypothetical protein
MKPLNFHSPLSLLIILLSLWIGDRNISFAEKLKCKTEVLSLMEIWERSSPGLTQKVHQTSNHYAQFEEAVRAVHQSGKLKFWNWKKDSVERVIVSHSFDNPYRRNVDVRFDPDKNCNVSSISFYEPEFTISGALCHKISRESRKRDTGLNTNQHRADVEKYIESEYLAESKKKSLSPADRKNISRVFDNCRNAAVIGRLAKETVTGMSDADYYREELKARQAN